MRSKSLSSIAGSARAGSMPESAPSFESIFCIRCFTDGSCIITFICCITIGFCSIFSACCTTAGSAPKRPNSQWCRCAVQSEAGHAAPRMASARFPGEPGTSPLESKEAAPRALKQTRASFNHAATMGRLGRDTELAVMGGC